MLCWTFVQILIYLHIDNGSILKISNWILTNALHIVGFAFVQNSVVDTADVDTAALIKYTLFRDGLQYIAISTILQ